ncbi:MAG: PAS domain-containing protein [Betaproteobacteria bacterium]|nr:PAS domain-containing protein [Betaproteobacteria bacterium]
MQSPDSAPAPSPALSRLLARLDALEEEASLAYRCTGTAHPLTVTEAGPQPVTIHPDDREGVQAALAGLAALGAMDTEYRVLGASGQVRWIRDRARVLATRRAPGPRIEGTWTDVTRRRAVARDGVVARSLLAGLVETLPSAMVLKSADGRWVHVNEMAARLHGRPVADLAGRTDRDLFPPERASRYALEDQCVLTRDEPLVVEECLADEAGCARQVSKCKHAFTGPDGAQWVAVHYTDVTAERRAALAATSHHALLDAVVRAAPNPMFMKDDQGHWISMNEAGAQFLGGSPADFLGRTADQVYPPDEAERIAREDHEALEREGARACEGPVTGIDGQDRWGVRSDRATILPDGRRLLLTSLVDLTQRRRAEATLAEYTELLQTLFQLSPDALAAFDGNGVLSASNGAFERVCRGMASQVGVARADTVLARLAALADDGNPPWLDALGRALSGSDAVAADAQPGAAARRESTLLRLARPEPRVFAATTRATGTDIAARLLFLRDVTRETELDELRNRFMATAAHELRTPLASIMGFSELLLSRRVGDEQRANALGIIHRQATLLRELLNELLDLSRLDSRGAVDLRLEQFDITALVAEVATDAAGSSKQHRIYVESAGQESLVLGDRARIAQVMGNLVNNAIKYSPDGGNVTVSVASCARDGAGGIEIRVTDEGIGMTAETLRRAFERFYRAETTGQIPGTGLGLSIVREILLLHGGDVVLESEPGRGTTARVWFPRVAAPSAVAA